MGTENLLEWRQAEEMSFAGVMAGLCIPRVGLLWVKACVLPSSQLQHILPARRAGCCRLKGALRPWPPRRPPRLVTPMAGSAGLGAACYERTTVSAVTGEMGRA